LAKTVIFSEIDLSKKVGLNWNFDRQFLTDYVYKNIFWWNPVKIYFDRKDQFWWIFLRKKFHWNLCAMLHVRKHSDILTDDFNGVCHNSDGLPSQCLSRYECQISKVSKILPKFWCKYFFLLQNVIVWNNALKKFIDMCTLILRCTNIILWLRLIRSEPFKDVIRRHPKLKVLRKINTHYLTQT